MVFALKSERLRAVRIACTGLLPEDALVLTTMIGALPEQEGAPYRVVERDYDICVVDPENPGAFPILRALPAGAVVVFAYREGRQPPPAAYLSVTRPFKIEDVQSVFRRAAARVPVRPAAPVAAPEAKREADLEDTRIDVAARPSGNLRRDDCIRVEGDLKDAAVLELHGLVELSLHLKGRPASGLFRIGALEFVLEIAAGVYYSPTPALDLRRYRGMDVPIRIIPIGHVRVGPSLGPRSLHGFLWELGLSAGAGRLLPGLDPAATYRIKRWPPLAGARNRSELAPITATFSKAPRTAAAIAASTHTPADKIHDYLNACWLTGCLEAVLEPRPTAQDAPSAPAAPPNLESPSWRERLRNALRM